MRSKWEFMFIVAINAAPHSPSLLALFRPFDSEIIVIKSRYGLISCALGIFAYYLLAIHCNHWRFYASKTKQLHCRIRKSIAADFSRISQLLGSNSRLFRCEIYDLLNILVRLWDTWKSRSLILIRISNWTGADEFYDAYITSKQSDEFPQE